MVVSPTRAASLAGGEMTEVNFPKLQRPACCFLVFFFGGDHMLFFQEKPAVVKSKSCSTRPRICGAGDWHHFRLVLNLQPVLMRSLGQELLEDLIRGAKAGGFKAL